MSEALAPFAPTPRIGHALCALLAGTSDQPAVLTREIGEATGVAVHDMDFGRAILVTDTRHAVDWLLDLGAPRDGGVAGLHDRLAADLRQAVVGMLPGQGRAVWLCGHGLGGGFAALTGLDLARAGLPVAVVTFGQPRVLREGGRPALPPGMAWWRYVTGGDVVADLPPDFVHAGEALPLGPDLDGTPADLDALLLRIARARAAHDQHGGDRTSGLAASVEALEPGLAAHRIDSYLDDLARLARREEARAARPGMAGAEPSAGDLILAEPPPLPAPMPAPAPARVPAPRPSLDDMVERSARPAIIRGLARAVREVIRLIPGQGAILAARRSEGSIDDVLGSIARESAREPGGLESGAGEETADDAGDEAPAAAGDAPEPAEMAVIVALHDDDWTPPPFVRVLAGFADYRAALVPEDHLDALRADPNVFNVELSREAGMVELVRSVPLVGANRVQAPDLDERGDRAVIGLIDGGIDILHAAFGDGAGGSRILAVWHQGGRSGPTPRQVDPALDADFGTLYTAAEIARLRGGPPAEVPAILRDGATGRAEFDGHGTHVAAIAAGRAFRDGGPGVAPEAGLIVVVPHIAAAPGDPPSIGYSASHVAALAFLKRVAAGGTAILPEARPMAVNISMGMNAGAHDGMTPLETAIDTITKKGTLPGFVIVKSAGNEGDSGRHARIDLGPLADTVEWEIKSEWGLPKLYLEGWYSHRHTLEFQLVGPNGDTTGWISAAGTVTPVVAGATCRIAIARYKNENADNQIAIEIRGNDLPIARGTWQLGVRGKSFVGTDRAFDLWIETTAGANVAFRQPDPDITLTVPGTADSVISVAACSNTEPPGVVRSSSAGPTRTGKVVKPEVAAPGEAIVSARAGTGDPDAAAAKSGTSMAAPHVTGAVALAMSALAKKGRPMNAVNLRARMVDTVRGADGVHHTKAGFGILDAEAFFRRALE